MRAFTKLLSSSLLRAISQDEHYGRHDFGNNFRLCLSLSTQKLKRSFLLTAFSLIYGTQIVLQEVISPREGILTVFWVFDQRCKYCL